MEVFVLLVILLFSWFVGSIGLARMREKQCGIPILIKNRFYCEFGSVLKVILVVKIHEKSSDKSIDFGGIPGETPV